MATYVQGTREWKMCYAVCKDTLVEDKCANCGHNVDSGGQMRAHTWELWGRRRSTLLTTARDNSRGVKSLGTTIIVLNETSAVIMEGKCIHQRIIHLCIITLSAWYMRGNDTPWGRGQKNERVHECGKTEENEGGGEETSNPGEKPFFVELSHMKRFQTKCQKLAWKATCRDFKRPKKITKERNTQEDLYPQFRNYQRQEFIYWLDRK